MVMDYGRWDPCDFIVSPGVRGTTGYRSSRSGRTSVACQPLHNYQDQRSFSIAVGHLPSTKRNISKSTRNLSLSNRTYEIKNGDGRKRSVSQTSQRSRRASSYSYNQENTFHTRKLSRKLSKSTVTICFSNRTISNTNSNKSAYHSNGNLDDNTSTEVDRDSYNVPKSEEISIADKVEDQMLNGEVVEPLDVKVKENFLLADKVKERLTFEDGLESRSSSCSIPRVRPRGEFRAWSCVRDLVYVIFFTWSFVRDLLYVILCAWSLVSRVISLLVLLLHGLGAWFEWSPKHYISSSFLFKFSVF